MISSSLFTFTLALMIVDGSLASHEPAHTVVQLPRAKMQQRVHFPLSSRHFRRDETCVQCSDGNGCCDAGLTCVMFDTMPGCCPEGMDCSDSDDDPDIDDWDGEVDGPDGEVEIPGGDSVVTSGVPEATPADDVSSNNLAPGNIPSSEDQSSDQNVDSSSADDNVDSSTEESSDLSDETDSSSDSIIDAETSTDPTDAESSTDSTETASSTDSTGVDSSADSTNTSPDPTEAATTSSDLPDGLNARESENDDSNAEDDDLYFMERLVGMFKRELV
ncbi:hypothetical protein C8J56DRAFT_1057150 [Mycena floridula]|nr:hypothetical protein C8J56DRAFT_1057150 [Mycena floridula]